MIRVWGGEGSLSTSSRTRPSTLSHLPATLHYLTYPPLHTHQGPHSPHTCSCVFMVFMYGAARPDSLWFTICAWAMWADCSSWYLQCGRKCGWGLALVHHLRLGHVGGL